DFRHHANPLPRRPLTGAGERAGARKLFNRRGTVYKVARIQRGKLCVGVEQEGGENDSPAWARGSPSTGSPTAGRVASVHSLAQETGGLSPNRYISQPRDACRGFVVRRSRAISTIACGRGPAMPRPLTGEEDW